ncbi:MAG: hypothetical protein AAGE59_28370 [Cyanobacteria bacterium P01_F01_bin.86]
MCTREGIKEVESFWINRKSDGRYGEQAVGPQVKYCIPKATEREINPQGKAQAEALARVMGDPVALREYYLAQKERERDRPVTYNELDGLASQVQKPDWLYDVLKGDKYNQTVGLSHIVRPLNRYVRGEWLTNATHATSVPSAMAQHHSQLKPWEVCNRDLPHGSIVAYYRSPLPNVGAVVLAINNTEVIRQQDPEAFAKQGVAYLPPSTAKDIAITDFDGDTNGFFVGYHATVQDLPEQVRQELETQFKGTSYEDGRTLLETLMQQCDSGQEREIKPADNPIAVREFAAANAPEVRPPTVVKQAKIKHPWKDKESLSAAIWRAWEKTAENPIGKVANAGMTLQSLALELKYAPEQREALLLQVSDNAQGLLQRVSIGKLTIPSDEWLRERGFPEYGFEERIKKLAKGAKYLESYTDPLSRRMLIDKGLDYAARLLMDAANGPNALNLQTAVDAAKSAQGIDENLHRFVKALQHKPDELRQHRKDHTNYHDGQTLLTNTQEPIAWGVQAVNELYQTAQMQQRGAHLHAASQGMDKEENSNIEYRSLFSKEVPSEQLAQIEPIVQTYRGLINAGISSKTRLSVRRKEDQQPTLVLTTAKGKALTIQMISDKGGQLPIWRADGPQPDWTVTISRNAKAKDAKYEFPVQLAYSGDKAAMGYVSPASAAEHQLAQWTAQQPLSIQGPSVETQVPYAQQNDSKYLFERANRYVEEVIAVPSEKDPMQYRTELASKLWLFHSGMKMALRHMPEVVTARLQKVPTITLNNLKYAGVKPTELIADGLRIIQFGTNTFVDKSGQEHTRRSVSIVEADGDLRQIGTIGRESIGLPSGATYMAAFVPTPTSPKSVDMQVMDLPTVEQTPAELTAFHEGRCHLTFDYEPHAAYGVRAGDIVVAQSEDGGEQISLRVKDQHKIKAAHVEKGAERWSVVERAPAHQFSEKFVIAQSAGKELWGLNVEPLGTYRKGQILPLPQSERQVQEQKVWAASISETVTLAYQLSPNKPAETQYYSISLDGTSLSLSLRDGSTLASFNLASGEVISADGLREIDVERWVENRQAIEQMRQSRTVSESASLER